MQLIIKGRHMAVTEAMHDYASEKVGRALKILNHSVIKVEVELYAERNPSIDKGQVAEVTVYTKGPVIRAREADGDMYAAIDLVTDKLERQFRKLKGKLDDRHSAKAARGVREPAIIPLHEEEPDREIVKTKVVEVKPMSQEEAILQLELLGHDFFVFASAETDAVSVLYRRRDGDYGLIQPRL